MAVHSHPSPTRPLPKKRGPQGPTFHSALVELQFVQQVLVDAHHCELGLLREEISRLRGNVSPRQLGRPSLSHGNILRGDRVTANDGDKSLQQVESLDDRVHMASGDAITRNWPNKRTSSCVSSRHTSSLGALAHSSMSSIQPSEADRDSHGSFTPFRGGSISVEKVKETYSSLMSFAEFHEQGCIGRILPRGWQASRLQAYVEARRLPCAWLEKITTGSTFGFVVSSILVLNVVFILIESDYSAKTAFRSYDDRQISGVAEQSVRPEWFVTADWFFLVLFSCELLARLFAEELRFFFGTRWRWNLFESTLVGVSAVEFYVSDVVLDATFARLIRLVRLSRVLKIVRVFKFFRELRLILESIGHILLPLTWSALTMTAMIAMFSVVFLHAVILRSQVQNSSSDDAALEDLRRYFHSLPMCALSLFMAISGGESWRLIVEPLMEISVVYALTFVVFIIFMQLGVLNIVTSIFVSNAAAFTQMDSDTMELAAAETHSFVMRKLRETFDALDHNGNGAITMDEFEQWTTNVKARAFFERVLHLEPWKVSSFFRLLDIDGNDSITREEFVVGCLRLKGDAKNLDSEMLQHFAKMAKLDIKKLQLQVAILTQKIEDMILPVVHQQEFLRPMATM